MTKPRAAIPDVTKLLPQFKAYHAVNPAWGTLHVVLDDLNIEDANVRFALEFAQSKGDKTGAELAEILLKCSKSQRIKISREGRANFSYLFSGLYPIGR